MRLRQNMTFSHQSPDSSRRYAASLLPYFAPLQSAANPTRSAVLPHYSLFFHYRYSQNRVLYHTALSSSENPVRKDDKECAPMRWKQTEPIHLFYILSIDCQWLTKDFDETKREVFIPICRWLDKERFPYISLLWDAIRFTVVNTGKVDFISWIWGWWILAQDVASLLDHYQPVAWNYQLYTPIWCRRRLHWLFMRWKTLLNSLC